MNKNTLRILIVIVAAVFLAAGARLLFMGFAQKEKTHTPKQPIVSAEAKESKTLRGVKELLTPVESLWAERLASLFDEFGYFTKRRVFTGPGHL